MRSTLAIAWREIVHHRHLLVAAAAAAVISLVVGWLPFIHSDSNPEATEVVATVIALLLAAAFSLGLGATFLGRDLSEGRLGFYLARPVSELSIWFGKLAAIYLLVIGSMLIVLLPALLTNDTMLEDLTEDILWAPLGVLLVMPLALILLAHILGVIVRARSAWMAVDLTALVVLTGLGWWSLRPLQLYGAHKAALVCSGILAGAAVLSMLVAGAVQVVVGRSDLRRAHRALSITLWGLLAVCSSATAGYSTWLRTGEPQDLDEVYWIEHAHRGDWVVVVGSLQGHFDYFPAFLLNVKTGGFVQLGRVFWWYSIETAFSRDGGTVVALMHEDTPGLRRVVRYDLTTPIPQRSDSLLTVERRKVSTWECSPSAGRIAVIEGGLLTIYDLDEERLLYSTALPGTMRSLEIKQWSMLFPDEDHLRIYIHDWLHLQILEVDIPTRSLRETGEVVSVETVENVSHWYVGWLMSFDVSADRMILRLRNGGDAESEAPVVVLDAVTGQPDPSFDTTSLQEARQAIFMLDGRVLAVVRSGARERLRVIDGHGAQQREIALKPCSRVTVGHQTSQRTVAVRARSCDDPESESSIFDVDLDTGAADPIIAGWGLIAPRGSYFWRHHWSTSIPVVPEHLYLRKEYRIQVYTPATGDLRPLITTGGGRS